MKLFLSHASEDKNDFVRPLADILRKNHQIWYDEYQLNVGDSLLQKIDSGLKICDFGIVVLSRAFFAKKWTKTELNGLLALETAEPNIILPIWHQVTEKEVKEFSPTLAGRLAAQSSQGINNVVNALELAINAATTTASFSTIDSIKKRLKFVETDLKFENNSKLILNSSNGVWIVSNAVTDCFKNIKEQVSQIQKELNLFKFNVSENHSSDSKSIAVKAPYSLICTVFYENYICNSAERATLTLKLKQAKNYFGDIQHEELFQKHLSPYIDSAGNVCWKDYESNMTNLEVSEFLLDILVKNIETMRNEQKINQIN